MYQISHKVFKNGNHYFVRLPLKISKNKAQAFPQDISQLQSFRMWRSLFHCTGSVKILLKIIKICRKQILQNDIYSIVFLFFDSILLNLEILLKPVPSWRHIRTCDQVLYMKRFVLT